MIASTVVVNDQSSYVKVASAQTVVKAPKEVPVVIAVAVPGQQGADGADGVAGPQGADGADGQGVPVGGTAGQVLEKIDGDDYNTKWASISANPGGADTQVQFNDGDEFAGDAGFTFDGNKLAVNKQLASNEAVASFNAQATSYPDSGIKVVRMASVAPFTGSSVGTGLGITQYNSSTIQGGIYISNGGAFTIESRLGGQLFIGSSSNGISMNKLGITSVGATFFPQIRIDATSGKEMGIYTSSFGNETMILTAGRTDMMAVKKESVNVGDTSATGARFIVNTKTASSVGQIVKAAASQTANLQEWQNSSGVAKTYVDSDQEIVATGAVAGESIVIGNGEIALTRSANGAKVASIRRNSSSTSHAVGWEFNSNASRPFVFSASGTEIATVGITAGAPTSTVGTFGCHNGYITNYISKSNADMTFTSDAASGSDGGIVFERTTRVTASNKPIALFRHGASDEAMRVCSNGRLAINNAAPQGQLHATSRAADVVTNVTQGAASQTANLQEWQDSGGTAQSYVDASGNFVMPNLPTSDPAVTGALWNDSGTLKIST